MRLIIDNKIFSTILNFEHKDYLNNFLIDNLSKLILFIIIKNDHLIGKIIGHLITDFIKSNNEKIIPQPEELPI